MLVSMRFRGQIDPSVVLGRCEETYKMVNHPDPEVVLWRRVHRIKLVKVMKYH